MSAADPRLLHMLLKVVDALNRVADQLEKSNERKEKNKKQP